MYGTRSASTPEVPAPSAAGQKGRTMYGLPKDFKGEFLVGRTLELICFAQYQVNLHFDENVSIVVESALSHQESSNSAIRRVKIPVAQSDLMVLLGHSILKAFGDDEGTLTIEFDNGRVLQCFDQPAYEAYHIIQGEDEIIV